MQTPFLARFADVSRRLGPGAAELRRALPLINGALRAGIPAFRRTPELGERLDQLLRRAGDAVGEPEHAAVAARPRRALQVSRPVIEQIAPYQTVCNYLVYFFNPLGTHLSETVPGGTQERIKAKLADLTQANTLGLTESLRPVDVPTNQDPQPARSRRCTRSTAARRSTRRATRTARAGQTGYPKRLVTNPRWPPDSSAGGFVGGGSHVVLDGNTPALPAGPTSRASSASTT